MSTLLDLLEIFANNIVPVLIVVGVGYTLAQFYPNLVEPLGKVTFYAFTPSLVFTIISEGNIGGAEFGLLFGGTVAYQSFMMLLGATVFKVLGADSRDQAVGTLSVGCQNTGNLGLSVIGFAFPETVLARAVVIFTGNMIANNTLGVYVASSGTRSPVRAFFEALRAPVLLTLCAAIVVKVLGISTPTIVARSVGLMSNAAIPVLLVLLGAQVARSSRLSHLRYISVSVALRLLGGPLVALLAVTLLSLSGDARTAFIIQCSMPTAVMTIILATEYQLNTELLSNTILVSLLLSPITLSVLILLFH